MNKIILPSDIEKRSMEIIDEKLFEMKIVLEEKNKTVIKRVIHTSADFDFAINLKFYNEAVEQAKNVLKSGTQIISDTNMIKSGINSTSLKKLNTTVHCFISDTDVAENAKLNGTTRAVEAMKKAIRDFPKGIYAIGNAPTALFELADNIEKGFSPSLVIAVPVGFVNVLEAKETITKTCCKRNIPCIVAEGYKGGSTIAVAICNALMYEALDVVEPAKRC